MPVTIISAVPKYISKEEHGQLTAATPSSFADIPPVLRHKQEHVRAVFDPPVQDLSEDDLKKGTVYILERSVSLYRFNCQYALIWHALAHLYSSPRAQAVVSR